MFASPVERCQMQVMVLLCGCRSAMMCVCYDDRLNGIVSCLPVYSDDIGRCRLMSVSMMVMVMMPLRGCGCYPKYDEIFPSIVLSFFFLFLGHHGVCRIQQSAKKCSDSPTTSSLTGVTQPSTFGGGRHGKRFPRCPCSAYGGQGADTLK